MQGLQLYQTSTLPQLPSWEISKICRTVIKLPVSNWIFAKILAYFPNSFQFKLQPPYGCCQVCNKHLLSGDNNLVPFYLWWRKLVPKNENAYNYFVQDCSFQLEKYTQLVDFILESLTYWNSTQTWFLVVSTMWSDIENETKFDIDFFTVYNVDTTSDPKRS